MKSNSVGLHLRKLLGRARRASASNYFRVPLVCVAIACAVFIRILHWQDNPTPPFHGMTGEYKAHAMALLQGDLKGFLSGPNPPSNAHVIKHPPGYPLLMAGVYRLFGDSEDALSAVHILFDTMAVVFVFLIAYELFSFRIAIVAAFLVAFSPQLAYHSIALLPDPLAALPLLVAVLLLIRAFKRPRLITIFASGIAIGVSCWFRSNTLLLPVFFCAALPVLFSPGIRLRSGAALMAGFLLLVVPVTIRNAVYFHSFIPLSLSAGITLVEGIGVYDKEKRFGLPDSDYRVTKWEAEQFQRSDYLGDRFGVDGVLRERYRISRGLDIIKGHPVWFAGVMFHRASSMLRLARVELVKPQAAVRHSLSLASGVAPRWVLQPVDIVSQEPLTDLRATVVRDGQALRIETNRQQLFTSRAVQLQPHTDCLMQLPLQVQQGHVVIDVIDADHNLTLTSTPVFYPVSWLDLKPEEQPAPIVEIPFVTGEANSAKIQFRLAGTIAEPLTVELGTIKGYQLGPASEEWTHYPRVLVRLIQKLFITAIMLPFVFIGTAVLIRQRSWPELVFLLMLSLYYMCTQSALWTEFRYILSMHYFLFIVAAFGLVWTGEFMRRLAAGKRRDISA